MARRNQRIAGKRRTGSLAAAAAGSELSAPSPPEIRRIVEALKAYDYGRSTVPWFELDQWINRTHEQPEARARIERELAQVLEAGVSLACKQEICRRLWTFGGEASLPSLERMLADHDPHAAEAACYAIASRPSAAADKALLKALGRREDGGLVAVITLLGDRRVAEAAGRLAGFAKRADGTAAAAIAALGKIASPKAVEALARLHAKSGPPGEQTGLRLEASHALLRCGRELLRQGKKEAAKTLLSRLAADAEPIRRGAKLALEEAG